MVIWRERDQKSKIKKFRTCGSLWVTTFSPMYKQYPMHEGLLPTSFSSQMKSPNKISFFKCSLYNPWPRSSQKEGKKSNDHGHIQVQFKV